MTEQKTELAQVAPDRSDAMKSNHMCVNVKGSPLAVPELYEHVFYDRTENWGGAQRNDAMTQDEIPYKGRHWFFTMFLEYPTFRVTLVRPKINVFHSVFGVSHFLGYSGTTENNCFSLCFWSMYPTFWDTYSGTTENHCFSLCFWSIPLFGILGYLGLLRPK